MLKYRCLVLDHDDTVVQTERAIGYPYFRDYIERIRPGQTLSYPEYVKDCNNMVFTDMCRQRWNFTEEELKEEYLGWKAFNTLHIPPFFPGIDKIVHRHKANGGLLCVISLSSREIITRDYRVHFGFQPDAIYDYDLPPEQRKPNTWPLSDLMSRFNLKPDEILVVDDMKLACLMASPLDVKTAFAGWSKEEFPELTEEMRALCDYSFNTVSEFEHFLFEGDDL